MAAHAKVEPLRISFQTASYAIVGLLRGACIESAATLSRQLLHLLGQSPAFVLPPRRTQRYIPRVVKKISKVSNSKNARQGLTDWH